jgi:hypothetical protein
MAIQNRRKALKTLARTGLVGVLSTAAFQLIRHSLQNPCDTASGCAGCNQLARCDDEKARAFQQKRMKE